MTRYILHSRSFGFLHGVGWKKSPTRCLVFEALPAARRAAKAAAKQHGVSVDLVDVASPPRRLSTRHEQTLRCLAHKDELDREIAKYERAGTLILDESNAVRQYGY